MADFGVRESEVGMLLAKEATQAQAVDSSLCAQNALVLGSRLPLELSVKGFSQTHFCFLNTCKYYENRLQVRFKNVHKPDMEFIVSFV